MCTSLNQTLFLILSIVLFWQCNFSPQEPAKKKNRESFESPIPNQLSEKEISAGWELLFDGKHTSHWRSFQSDTFPFPNWYIDVEGNLATEKNSKSIVTKRDFENFDFKIDFQMTPQTNAGIYYRIQESEKMDLWRVGLEYQIIDSILLTNAGDISTHKHSTGDVYDLYESEKSDLRQFGEWNRARIVILNNHVEHWLNGKMILQYQIGDEKWKSNISKSKYRSLPKFGKLKFGQIGLSGSPTKIKFRNIKIKEL